MENIPLPSFHYFDTEQIIVGWLLFKTNLVESGQRTNHD